MRRSKSAIVALVAAVLAVVVMLETGGATAPRELAPLSAHTLTHPSQGIVLAAKKRPAPSPVRVTIARQSRPGIRIPFRVRLVLRDKAVRGARVQISILQAAGAKTKVSPKTGRTNRKGFFRGTVLLSKKPGVTVLLVIAGHYRKGVVIQTAVPTHAPSLPFGLGRATPVAADLALAGVGLVAFAILIDLYVLGLGLGSAIGGGFVWVTRRFRRRRTLVGQAERG